MNDQQLTTDFAPFAKIPRLSRDIIVTEKIDGTNAQICIVPCEECPDATGATAVQNGFVMFVGSRTRWIRPKNPGEKPDTDNYGFAAWCRHNADELFKLGPGRHFGEWFGAGINRTYGLKEKRFALFNVNRWIPRPCGRAGVFEAPKDLTTPEVTHGPNCCYVVPILYQGPFDMPQIQTALDRLETYSSRAVPGFTNPEGIVIYHTAGGYLFKKTIKDDESPKSVITDCQLRIPQHISPQTDRLADYVNNQ